MQVWYFTLLPRWAVQEQQFIVISGKGGVGRTTVALATALALATRGRRVALAEVHGARSLARIWGTTPRGADPITVAPGLDLFSLDAAACLRAYTTDRLPRAPMAGAVFGSRLLRAFLDGLPGMGDLLHLGFLHSLVAQGLGDHAPWDVVVIDPPPTGHGVAFTLAADAMARMTAEGPIHDESDRIGALLRDAHVTLQWVVTLPERLPASEAVQLVDQLGPQAATVGGLFVNRVRADPFSGVPWPVLRTVLVGEPDGQALCAVGDRATHRMQAQRDALDLLQTRLALPLRALPEAEILSGPASYRALSRHLGLEAL